MLKNFENWPNQKRTTEMNESKKVRSQIIVEIKNFRIIELNCRQCPERRQMTETKTGGNGSGSGSSAHGKWKKSELWGEKSTGSHEKKSYYDYEWKLQCFLIYVVVFHLVRLFYFTVFGIRFFSLFRIILWPKINFWYVSKFGIVVARNKKKNIEI